MSEGPVCHTHGCALLPLASGDLVCPQEYADELVGGRQVVDFLRGGGGVSGALIFDNRRSWPILCPDCGRICYIEDSATLRQFQKIASGWVLVDIAYAPVTGDSPEGLLLAFLPPGAVQVEGQEELLLLHPRSALEIA